MTRAAPLPGVLILTTTPPLYLPSLLLASHIRHPLKESYPSLLAEQWAAHLASHGIETASSSAEPIVWLKGVPSIKPLEQDDEEEAASQHADESGEEEADDDHEDEDGNVWRGLNNNGKVTGQSTQQKDSRTDPGTAVANLTIGQVTYLAPVPPGTDPLLPLSFLQHLHSVLLCYFPATSSSSSLAASPNAPTPIPAATLSTNFDLLYQLLQEMLDDGRPLTTEYNSIKGTVRGRAWWEDIIGRMGSIANATPPPPIPQIPALPWRPAQVRYTRNEVYVDIVESLSGVMDREGKSVGGLELIVSVGCRSKLSGNPDLALALHPSPKSPSTPITAPSLHPCVRTRRWAKEGLLSFIPPDGDFQLAQFSMTSSVVSKGSSSAQASSSRGPWEKDLPFTLTAKRLAIKETKGREWEFEIRLTSAGAGRSSPSSSEGIEVSFQVDPGQALFASGDDGDDGGSSISVDARTSVSSGSFTSSSSSSAATASGDDAGDWRFDSRLGLVKWTIPRLGSSHGPNGTVSGPSEVTLKGTVTTGGSGATSTKPSPSPLLVAFSLPPGVPSMSGVRVSSLQVTGVDFKPFKGVRGATRGKLEWRW